MTSQRLPFDGRIRSARLSPPVRVDQGPAAAAVTRQGMNLIIKFSRPHPPFRKALQQIDGCRFDSRHDTWLVHVGMIREVRARAAYFGWHTSPQVDAIPDLAPGDFPVVVRVEGEMLAVEVPFRMDVHEVLLEHEATHEPRSGLWYVDMEDALDVVLDIQRIATVSADGDFGQQVAFAAEMLGLSRAMAPSPGFTLAPTIARDMTNRPFTIAGTEYGVRSILRRTGGVFLWGTMGSGKSAIALAILETLDVVHDVAAYPAVLIVPMGIKTNWEREIAASVPHRRVHTCESSKPVIPIGDPDLWICNYDILGNPAKSSWSRTFTEMGVASVAFDEIHRIKELKTQRSRACQAISLALPPENPRLGLTGTPVRNRRKEILPQLIAMGRGEEVEIVTKDGEHTGKFKIVTQFGDQKKVLADERLSRRLRTVCAWRPDPDEVLRSIGALGADESSVIVPEWFVVDGDPKIMAEYRRAEQMFLEWIRERAEAKARELGLDPTAAGVTAVMKAGSAAALVQINALCRLAGQAKAPAVREWVRDFADSGDKLLVFAHHHDVMDMIAGDDYPQIHGGVKHRDRMVLVDRFQGDMEPPIQVLVLQTEAAGEGLTLTEAHHDIHAEFEWVPGAHDQADSRAAWRMNDPHPVHSVYAVCANTVDEWRIGVLAGKRQEMALVTGEDRSKIATESTFGEVWDQFYKKALGEEA